MVAKKVSMELNAHKNVQKTANPLNVTRPQANALENARMVGGESSARKHALICAVLTHAQRRMVTVPVDVKSDSGGTTVRRTATKIA